LQFDDVCEEAGKISSEHFPTMIIMRNIDPTLMFKIRDVALKIDNNAFVQLATRCDALMMKVGFPSGTYMNRIAGHFASKNKLALYRGLRGPKTPYWIIRNAMAEVSWRSGTINMRY
jgi:hypothetical protein